MLEPIQISETQVFHGRVRLKHKKFRKMAPGLIMSNPLIVPTNPSQKLQINLKLAQFCLDLELCTNEKVRLPSANPRMQTARADDGGNTIPKSTILNKCRVFKIN
jgi:hypothetical protein